MADFNKNLVEVPGGSNPIVLYQALVSGWDQAWLTPVVKEAVAQKKRGEDSAMINLTAPKKPDGQVRRSSRKQHMAHPASRTIHLGDHPFHKVYAGGA